MKKNKKVIAITLSIVLGAVFLIGSIPFIYMGANKIKGTEAAKILLARENMNNADESFDWENLFEEGAKNNAQPINSPFTANFNAVTLNDITPFSSADLGELVHQSPAGKVYKNNGEYNFKDISGASSQGLVVESRLFEIDYRVESAAKNINYLKNELNIVNKWVKDGNSKFYLDVTQNKETLLEYYEDDHGIKSLWVVERETRADSNSVYSLMYTSMEKGVLDNPVFLVYIPNERYEYYYGHDGNATDYLIAEQDKGYWNIFMPDKDDYRSVIISDEFAFHSYGEYTSLGDDYGTVSTVDLKEDIVSNYSGGLTIHLSAFNGISGIFADEQTCFINSYDGGEKTYIDVNYADRNKLKVGLDNGEYIALNDQFAYSEGTIKVDDVYFEFYTNPGFADPQYDVSLVLEMNVSLSLKEKLSLLETFLNDNGLTCKYELTDIENNILKNSEIANSLPSFYTWNGYLMNSDENFTNAESVIFNKINALFNEYESVKGAEEVKKFMSAKVAKRQTFAKVDSLTLNSATYNAGKIQIDNLSITVEKSKVLEKDTEYKLQIGLARIDENGNFLSQNTVDLKTVDTVTSVTYDGNDFTLSASGEYDIPTALEENRYVVVAYAVTNDEQIRVSEMKAIGFVDTINDTIETSAVKINITSVEERLIVEYTTKLYFNVTANAGTSYTELRRKMMAQVLKYGYPINNEEITDANGNKITDQTISSGEYKLKFVISTIDGAVTGYVICVVA